MTAYPSLVDLVLGTVGGDPGAAWFGSALMILRLMLDVLGGALWAGASFPPATLCDFLIGAGESPVVQSRVPRTPPSLIRCTVL